MGVVFQLVSIVLSFVMYGLIFVGVIATAITGIAVLLGGPLLTMLWGLLILGSGLGVGRMNRSIIAHT